MVAGVAAGTRTDEVDGEPARALSAGMGGRFQKVEGLGNDFILIDRRGGGEPPTDAAAVRLCDRRRGIGADGVLTLLPPRGRGALSMLIQNSDGSVPEMCGNGLRCVIRVLGETRPEGIAVETGAGLRFGRIEDDGRVWITLGPGRVVSDEIAVGQEGLPRRGVAVDVGNPHLVVFIDDAQVNLRALAAEVGPTLEHHRGFPNRVNVGFARRNPEGIELVVFERGAGLTEACGTGAAAAALAARHFGRDDLETRVWLPGGELGVRIPHGGEVELVGPARRVFEGEIPEWA